MNPSLLPENLAIAKLPPGENVPAWAVQADFFSIRRTRDELSIVGEGRGRECGGTSCFTSSQKQKQVQSENQKEFLMQPFQSSSLSPA